jgi:hypothetical protein
VNYHFINTDAVSNGDTSFHDTWIHRGIAVTSGHEGYRDKINRIKRGDTVLLYVKRVGVVAVGTMLDDRAQDVHAPATVSPREPVEYQRKVKWFTDIRNQPLHYDRVREMRGQYPLSSVDTLKKGREDILEAIQLLAR